MSSTARSSSILDHYNHQSFSSTLLEEIYRSFDYESDHHPRMAIKPTVKSTMKKSTSCCYELQDDRNYTRSRANPFVAVDRWIENESETTTMNFRRQINHSSSSTSSSDSSSGVGGFSSSDTESVYGPAKPPKPPGAVLKPIRTTAKNLPESCRKNYSDEIPAKKKNKKNKEGNLQRRALKLYSELKKVKQPISPGGKLTSFLNSLFHSGAASKKPNISSTSPSPATTTSRSCLSKTPSSAGRVHRSVRFVDDDNDNRGNNNSQSASRSGRAWENMDVTPLGKPVQKGNELKCSDVAKRDLSIKDKQRRVEEVAKEVLKNYHNHNNRKELKVNIVVPDTIKFDRHNNIVNKIRNFEEIEDEEDDDDVSCGSSDLFELENFTEIGMVDRYGEELPVYETTHVGTNRAIANGFIL